MRKISRLCSKWRVLQGTVSFEEVVVMKASCYRNTKITLPNWVPNSRLNEECPLGFAYEDGDFYVHMYGMGEGLYTIFPGLVDVYR